MSHGTWYLGILLGYDLSTGGATVPQQSLMHYQDNFKDTLGDYTS